MTSALVSAAMLRLLISSLETFAWTGIQLFGGFRLEQVKIMLKLSHDVMNMLPRILLRHWRWVLNIMTRRAKRSWVFSMESATRNAARVPSTLGFALSFGALLSFASLPPRRRIIILKGKES
jgi:hypothetical protein